MYTHTDHASSIICDTSESVCNSNRCILKHLPLKKRFCSRKPQLTFSVVNKSIETHTSKFSDFQLVPAFDLHHYQVNKSTVLAHTHSYKSHSNFSEINSPHESLIVNKESHRLTKLHHPSEAAGQINSHGEESKVLANSYPQISSPSYSVQSPGGSQGKSSTSNGDQFYETCSTCHKTFYTENSFKIHLRRHLNKESGKYKCKVCGQTFSQRSGQVSHSRVHTREKPYLCDMCPKRFADFSTYTKHKRVHTGEKPYSCPCCHSSFSQSGNLHRHVRVVHKVQSTTSRN